jgi:hypothetical protein
MSVNGRVSKLESEAESMPCPVCGRGGRRVDVRRLTDAELEAIASHEDTKATLRDCTTEELRAIREILANARRRAGRPEKDA